MATMAPDLERQTKELYAAFNAHDLEKFLSLHTEDVLVENVATGVVSRGIEEIRSSFSKTFAAIPDLKLELISFFASGNRQCEEIITTGTHTGDLMGIPATGKNFSVRGVLVRELRGAKTCRVTQYGDSATLMRQLGVSPSPPHS